MSHIQPEQTISSETVFSGRLINVRKDTIRLPNGRTTVREIVVHPDVVAVLPVLEDDRIVLVRQYRKAADRVLLEVPAGGIDGDETPEEAVRREMIEETGYRVGAVRLLNRFFTSPGYTSEFMYLYEATQLQPGEPTEEIDQIEVVLLSLEEAIECMNAGEIADAKSILALMACAAVRSGPVS
jgi:ADP-ribose pyrophosphatase